MSASACTALGYAFWISALDLSSRDAIVRMKVKVCRLENSCVLLRNRASVQVLARLSVRNEVNVFRLAIAPQWYISLFATV